MSQYFVTELKKLFSKIYFILCKINIFYKVLFLLLIKNLEKLNYNEYNPKWCIKENWISCCQSFTAFIQSNDL